MEIEGSGRNSGNPFLSLSRSSAKLWSLLLAASCGERATVRAAAARISRSLYLPAPQRFKQAFSLLSPNLSHSKSRRFCDENSHGARESSHAMTNVRFRFASRKDTVYPRFYGAFTTAVQDFHSNTFHRLTQRTLSRVREKSEQVALFALVRTDRPTVAKNGE